MINNNYIAGTLVVTPAALTAGNVSVKASGDIKIAEGAVLELSGIDFATLAKKRYVFAQATGTVTGSFAQIVGLDKDWHVIVSAHGIRLAPVSGNVIYVR